jgi:sulfur-oxidizing protein SoxZ
MAKHRARATAKPKHTVVKAIINHPMETGLRKDKKSGKKIPAHFIEELKVTANGKQVLAASWGPAVSKNPLLHFNYKGGKKGDKIVISWSDNKGQKDKIETTVR